MIEMKRFYIQSENTYGNIIVRDFLNTEPVCVVFARFHPYAVDIIDKALQDYQSEIITDKCKCGNDKPKEWLHCGCGISIKERDVVRKASI